MMETWANPIFYLVFTSQILLMSYYIPNKILGRMRHVLANYPVEQYGKLYTQPIEHYKIGHAVFAGAYRVIFVLGFLILLAAATLDGGTMSRDGHISEIWPAMYAMLQFMPILALEFAELSHLKEMRMVSTNRSANLQRRRLFDMVSPVWLAAAVALYLSALGINYLAAGRFEFDHAVTLTLGHAVMLAYGLWSFFSKKRDPHQSFDDRTTQIGAMIRSAVAVSLAISVFFIIKSLENLYDIPYLDAIVMSLYFQAIGCLSTYYMLRAMKLEEIDFEVYRTPSAAT